MRRLDESPPRSARWSRTGCSTSSGPPAPVGRGPDRRTEEDLELPVDVLDADPGRPLARSFARVHLAVVTVLVLVGLCGAGWALFRARPVAVATPDVVVAASTSRPGVEASGSASASASARPGHRRARGRGRPPAGAGPADRGRPGAGCPRCGRRTDRRGPARAAQPGPAADRRPAGRDRDRARPGQRGAGRNRTSGILGRAQCRGDGRPEPRHGGRARAAAGGRAR